MHNDEADAAQAGALENLSVREAEATLQQLAGVFFGGALNPLAGAAAKPARAPSTEEQGHLAEVKYRTLVEQIPVVTFMAQFDGGLEEIYVSPQIETMLGYSQKEWVEDPVLWYERLHPDDRERWTHDFARTLTEDAPFGSVYRFMARDGHVVWVRGEIKIVRDEFGLPLFIQGVGFDVTEMKQAEEAKTLLAAIVESSGDAIIGQKLDGTIVSWNPAAASIYGYGEDEIVGRPVSLLIPSERRDEASHLLQSIRQGKRVEPYETVHLTKDGQSIAVSLTISSIKDGDGKIFGASMISRDITRRKEAEEKLRASLREKEVLLKEIHHRVKNNLQITSSLFSLQSASVEDPALLEMFRESENRIKSMALVHEKLYQSSNLARIDMAEYLQTLVPSLMRSYGGSAANISLRLDVENVPLGIDQAIPFGLIVNELVSNSLKHAFAPGAHGELQVSLHPEDDGVRFTVADDGQGFPAEVDFRQTPSLGLQLVNTLTRQLGGTIEMHRDGGTRFRIKFKVV